MNLEEKARQTVEKIGDVSTGEELQKIIFDAIKEAYEAGKRDK